MAKFKREDGKEYNDERKDENSEFREAVQVRIIADERIRERAAKRQSQEQPKRKGLLH